jgi:hypothetical protein
MIASLALALACLSADLTIVLDSTRPETYVVTVDGSGGLTIRLGQPSPVPPPTPPTPPTPTPPPIPTPPPPPTPPPTPPPAPILTDRAKEFKSCADSIASDPRRAETAAGLALLYRKLIQLAKDGTIKDSKALFLALQAGNDQWLAGRNVSASWQAFRDKQGFLWSVIDATPAATGNDYLLLLKDCADGLDASAGKSLSPELIALIMQIIQLVLSLLQK